MAEVYALIDPNTGECRYVGKTVQKLNLRCLFLLQEKEKPIVSAGTSSQKTTPISIQKQGTNSARRAET